MNFIFNKLSKYLNTGKFFNIKNTISQRVKITSEKNKLNICIHEWGGYDWIREKKIENRNFGCGLKFHLERLENYKGSKKIKTTFTISDYPKFKYKEELKSYNVIPVENIGMDLAGYSRFLRMLPSDNEYVLLMNSSIASFQVDFIDEYLDYFERHPEIGMLGISYNTKCYQTFIKNNFRPHIQSFFILTTSAILRDVTKLNNGKFPGENENYKRSIIRFGEIRLTELILKMNYKVTVILDNGQPYSFYRNSFWDNGFGRWSLPFGDCRKHFENVNYINKLNI